MGVLHLGRETTPSFIFRHLVFTPDFNKHKNDARIKGISTQIILDYSRGTFDFAEVLLHEKRDYFRNLLIFNALQDGLEPTTP